jgi:putative flippase GtrA
MSLNLKNRLEWNRFLKFLTVGAIGAVVDFGIMNILTKLLGISLVFAGTVSFISAIISNFLFNRYWTYPDSRSRPIGRQLAMFFLVNFAGLLIRIPILHFLETPMQNWFTQINLNILLTPQFLGKNATLAVAVVIVMLWNYFVNRYWTYNDIKSGNQIMP